jgi:hypothetical protein
VAPLRLGGLRGKQSTPSVGWEVPVRSRRSASGSSTERADAVTLEQAIKATVCFSFCMIEGIRTLALFYCYQHFYLGL